MQAINFQLKGLSKGHVTGNVTKGVLAPRRGSRVNLGFVVQAGINMFLPENITVNGLQCDIVLQNNITGGLS